MLTIKQEQNQDVVADFLQKQGSDVDLSDDIVMTSRDGETMIGLGSLSLNAGKVYLNHIIFAPEFEDELMVQGLAKALLNLADLRGIRVVYGAEPALEKLYAALGFQNKNEEYVLQLEGYFTKKHS